MRVADNAIVTGSGRHKSEKIERPLLLFRVGLANFFSIINAPIFLLFIQMLDPFNLRDSLPIIVIANASSAAQEIWLRVLVVSYCSDELPYRPVTSS